jgi:serine/threonine-protein kinase
MKEMKMTDREEPLTAAKERDCTIDPIDPLVAETLAKIMFPRFEEVDLNAPVTLTDEQRKALAALGSPAELVARIIATFSAKSTVNSSTPQFDTQVEIAATTSTQITARPQLNESPQAFCELLQGLDDCEKDDRLSWSYDYWKERVIGRGGQGTVYLTECLNEHNLPKALKVFSPAPYGACEAYYEDMERMSHVASLVYRMQVDNLVTVERFDYRHGIGVMIMRWIDGHDLADLLKPGLLEQLRVRVDEDRWKHLNDAVVTTCGTSQLRLMPGMAVNIIEKCLRALDALHSEGIVHGDIKPSNIMLDRYGSIRMVDIGSAFNRSAPPHCHVWTPLYAPPEILEGEPWTPQGDLASLGYVLIELLSGQPAILDIGSDSTRVLGKDWDPRLLEEKRRLPDRLADIVPIDVRESPHLMNILRRLIDPDPEKRFANAEDALIGPSGTYQFMQGLSQMGYGAPFSQEIKHWLADVKTAEQSASVN